MSGDKGTSPCNKFQANIFNKSKCQNCFKSRELHLLSDHGMDKAKPVYGGWLCLAPEGTDFTNPMQRSRKWQRRFFILYEHGSLTFALDELPSTLPQGTVNMTQCTEVLDAEPYTGQRNAICITGPHLELFIRAESRDIIHGWCEQLAVYPRTNKQKKKRKVDLATPQEPSPAKMAATELCFSATESADVAPTKMAASELCFSAEEESAAMAPGAGACLGQEEKVSGGSERDSVWPMTNADKPPAASSPPLLPAPSSCPLLSPPCPFLPSPLLSSPPCSLLLPLPDLVASRDPALTSDPSLLSISSCTSLSSLDSDLAADLDSDPAPDLDLDPDPNNPASPGRRITSPTAPPNSFRPSAQISGRNTPGRCHQEKDGRSVERAELCLTEVAQEAGHNLFRKGRSHQREKLSSCGEAPVTQLSAPPAQRRARSLDRRTSESTMTPDLLNFKKGWLVKLDKGDQWRKYWFVLSADSLRYYKDSVAEEAADMEGDMDLTQCYNVSDYQVHRNYGFQIHTRTRVYTLSAMTAGIRRNWIQALLKNVHPSHAPDIASMPGCQLHPCSPPETLPQPDVTQESLPPLGPLHTEGDPLLGPRPSRARERRREGRSKTFDWAEFRPPTRPSQAHTAASSPSPTTASSPSPTPSPTAEKTEASPEAELGEAGRRRRREERRRRYESVLGFPVGWELQRGDKEEEEGEGGAVLSPRAQREVEEEIERCWQQVERAVVRWDQTVPLCPETRGDGHIEPSGNIPLYPDHCESASLPSSTQNQEYSDRLERLLDTHSKRLDTPPIPDIDHDAATTSQKPSSYQSLTDTYRETKELLQQQQLIRQSLQQQLGFSSSTNQGLSGLSSTMPSDQKLFGFSSSVPADQHQLVSSTTPPVNPEPLSLSPVSVSSDCVRRHSDPQPPSIWLQDAEGNLQELERSDPVFLAASPARGPELGPASLPQPGAVGEPDPKQNHQTTLPVRGEGGSGRRRWASNPDTRHVGEAQSLDPPTVERIRRRSDDLAGGKFDHRWSSGSREEQRDQDPNQGAATARQLAQDVALLTSQNQALNQRNQEMVNQLTEADREIDRLRAELSARQSASQVREKEEEERAARDRTRAEGLEAELCRTTRQLQEARSLAATLEGRLRDAETQLQIREAELRGMREGEEEEDEEEDEDEKVEEEENKAEQEEDDEEKEKGEVDKEMEKEVEKEEDDVEKEEEEVVKEEVKEVQEEEDEEVEEEKKEEKKLNLEEAVETKERLELDKEVVEEGGDDPLRREEDKECIQSLVPEKKPPPFELTYGDAETHHGELRQPVWEDAGGEPREGGDRMERLAKGEERIQQVAEEMLTRAKVLGRVLEVIEGSAMSAALSSASELDMPQRTTTTSKRLRFEEEFWAALSVGLKACQSQGNKCEDDEILGGVLSGVAEGMAVEKQMLRLAHHLLFGTQAETDSTGTDQPNGSLGELGITDEASAETMPQRNEEEETMPQRNEEEDEDEDEWLLLSACDGRQQGDTGDDVSSRFVEIMQTRMSLYKQIASSISASSDDQYRSETSPEKMLCFDTSTSELWSMADSLSRQYPWSPSVHCAVMEAFSTYRLSRFQTQHETELQRTRLRQGLSPSLPCSRCPDLEKENQELRDKLEVRNLEKDETGLGDAQEMGTVVRDGPSLGACEEEDDSLRDSPGREKEGDRSTAEEVRCREEVEKREEVERLRREEVSSLSAKVRHLEACLSAVVAEMTAEHDGRLAFLRLEHDKELEDMKARYEQGVASLEEGQRRVLEELQQRQQLALDTLKREQDRLLEEEAAATLTALAAMKRAYRAELEREARRDRLASSSLDLEDTHREELVGCQQELEVLSQQHSLRCQEVAHLSQELATHTRALGSALEDCRCLRTHNQELTLQLAAEVSRRRSPAQQEASSPGPERDLYDLEISVRVRDCEVTCLKQEVTSLRDQLHTAQKDKKLVSEQFQAMSAELSATRARAGRDLDALRQNLVLARRALEAAPTHTHNGVYKALLF